MSAHAISCSQSRRIASTPVRALHSRRAFLKSSASVLLLSGVGGSLLSACGGSVGSDLPETPRLASVNNFRDVAGAAAGYPTVDGKQMRRGVFYRSNVLTFSAQDQAVVDKLGIVSVYDLRTPGEVARTADLLPAGATSQTFNVLGTLDATTPMFDTAGAANGFLEGQARGYVNGGVQRAAFGALLKRLAEGPGAQLFHSNAGKDRTGWVAALLLSIANVPLDVIMQDYLLSNVYSAPTIKAQLDTLRAQDGDAIATTQAPLLGVQESYLQAGFDQVQSSYGTMENYLTKGLGLAQETIDTLRDRLVG
ncbi:protein-tyrosine phosphatase [Paraburkholderia sp. GAS199]|uniref:tyrosine-protein phosphatase n=1 Tax=Paraburkholderia sp. GAS199 TaxID=3035126 RepID=UPI003D1FDE0D